MCSLRNRDYTYREDESILNFIIERQAFNWLRGELFWKQMSEVLGRRKVINRTWKSLSSHFQRKIVNELHVFNTIPKKDRDQIIKGWKSSSRPINIGREVNIPKPRIRNAEPYVISDDSDDASVRPISKRKKTVSSDEEDEVTKKQKRQDEDSDSSIDFLEEDNSRRTPNLIDHIKIGTAQLSPRLSSNSKSKHAEFNKSKNTNLTNRYILDSDETSVVHVTSSTDPENSHTKDSEDKAVEFSLEDDALLLNFMKLDRTYLKSRTILRIYEFFTEMYSTDKTPRQLRARFLYHIIPNISTYTSLLSVEEMCQFCEDLGIVIPNNMRVQNSPCSSKSSIILSRNSENIRETNTIQNSPDFPSNDLSPMISKITSTHKKATQISLISPPTDVTSINNETIGLAIPNNMGVQNSPCSSTSSIILSRNRKNINETNTIQNSPDFSSNDLSPIISKITSTQKKATQISLISPPTDVASINNETIGLAIPNNMGVQSSPCSSSSSIILSRNRKNIRETNTIQNSLDFSSNDLSPIISKITSTQKKATQISLISPPTDVTSINNETIENADHSVVDEPTPPRQYTDAKTTICEHVLDKNHLNCSFFDISINQETHVFVFGFGKNPSKENILKVLSARLEIYPENIHFIDHDSYCTLNETFLFVNSAIHQLDNLISEQSESENLNAAHIVSRLGFCAKVLSQDHQHHVSKNVRKKMPKNVSNTSANYQIVPERVLQEYSTNLLANISKTVSQEALENISANNSTNASGNTSQNLFENRPANNSNNVPENDSNTSANSKIVPERVLEESPTKLLQKIANIVSQEASANISANDSTNVPKNTSQDHFGNRSTNNSKNVPENYLNTCANARIVSEKVLEEYSTKLLANIRKTVTQKALANISANNSINVPGNTSQNLFENRSADNSKNVPENDSNTSANSQIAPERVLEESPTKLLPKIANIVSQEASANVSANDSTNVPENTSQDLFGNRSTNNSKNVPENDLNTSANARIIPEKVLEEYSTKFLANIRKTVSQKALANISANNSINVLGNISQNLFENRHANNSKNVPKNDSNTSADSKIVPESVLEEYPTKLLAKIYNIVSQEASANLSANDSTNVPENISQDLFENRSTNNSKNVPENDLNTSADARIVPEKVLEEYSTKLLANIPKTVSQKALANISANNSTNFPGNISQNLFENRPANNSKNIPENDSNTSENSKIVPERVLEPNLLAKISNTVSQEALVHLSANNSIYVPGDTSQNLFENRSTNNSQNIPENDSNTSENSKIVPESVLEEYRTKLLANISNTVSQEALVNLLANNSIYVSGDTSQDLFENCPTINSENGSENDLNTSANSEIVPKSILEESPAKLFPNLSNIASQEASANLSANNSINVSGDISQNLFENHSANNSKNDLEDASQESSIDLSVNLSAIIPERDPGNISECIEISDSEESYELLEVTEEKVSFTEQSPLLIDNESSTRHLIEHDYSLPNIKMEIQECESDNIQEIVPEDKSQGFDISNCSSQTSNLISNRISGIIENLDHGVSDLAESLQPSASVPEKRKIPVANITFRKKNVFRNHSQNLDPVTVNPVDVIPNIVQIFDPKNANDFESCESESSKCSSQVLRSIPSQESENMKKAVPNIIVSSDEDVFCTAPNSSLSPEMI